MAAKPQPYCSCFSCSFSLPTPSAPVSEDSWHREYARRDKGVSLLHDVRSDARRAGVRHHGELFLSIAWVGTPAVRCSDRRYAALSGFVLPARHIDGLPAK